MVRSGNFSGFTGTGPIIAGRYSAPDCVCRTVTPTTISFTSHGRSVVNRNLERTVLDRSRTFELQQFILRQVAGDICRRSAIGGACNEREAAGSVRRNRGESSSRRADGKNWLAVEPLTFGFIHHQAEVVVVDDICLIGGLECLSSRARSPRGMSSSCALTFIHAGAQSRNIANVMRKNRGMTN